MSFTTVPTVSNGDAWSAAQHNTYLRDNMAALWPYTMAGDIAYASAANTLSRLALSSGYKMLVPGASAPEWGNLHFASVYSSVTQNVPTGVSTAIAFNGEVEDVQGWHSTSVNTSRITIGETGKYQASTWLEYAGAGGSGQYWDTLEFRKNGAVWFDDRRRQEVDVYSKKFILTTPVFLMTAGDYLELFLEQTSGGTRTVEAGTVFSLWRVK